MKHNTLILDRYRLVERIALGGTAEVWRAHDEQLARTVAVKRLHAHLLPDEASRARLAAEARAAAGLSHPVIVDVYDVDTSGETAAIVMELIDGESLASRIADTGPLAVDDAVRITAELAEALYHAHRRGIVHRDVKPGNVLLSADGRTRLVDFGIARSLAQSAERLTLTGTVLGTLSAMAPEQLAGGPIGPRTDLYGLGVVLHEALTGHPPYAATSPLALAEAQRSGPPDLDSIDPALASVIAACLSHDPRDRPPHAGALATTLRDWLAGDESTALAMSPAMPSAPGDPVDTEAITQLMPVEESAAAPIATGTRETARGRRDRGVSPRAVIGSLVALAVVTLVLLAARSEESPLGVPPSPSATSPSVAPEWLAGRLEEIEKHCGAEIAAGARAELAEMGEEEAKAYAEELVDSCREEDDDGGRGRGNGRGGGNGRDDDD